VTAGELSCFAITAPGLEPITAAELHGLGITGALEDGGVSWAGHAESLVRANLWLRTASRVVVRIAEFHARTFYELERHARRIPWGRVIAPGSPVAFRVTCRKSKLYHSDAVAERLAQSIDRTLRAASRYSSQSQDDVEEREQETQAEQLFVVRVLRDVCTVSADSSGALLHLRGYRRAVAKAPLRETLAAAMLLACGWRGDMPLTDPMCGAGTILIEAALIARRIAPGLHRRFAFLHWPGHYGDLWQRLVAEAERTQIAASPVRIAGADRDEGAIAAAGTNAERAGVTRDVELATRAISALEPADGPGLIATNPPYGVRIGEIDRLRNLYAQLGHVLRRARPEWSIGILSAEPRLDRQLGFELAERFRTRNGGIPVRLLVGNIGRIK